MSTPPNEMQQFSTGVVAATVGPAKVQITEQEQADVKRWLGKIDRGRKFDEAARRQYARDRKYARADSSGFDVDVPIAGTYVDILKTFLYARDPDVDVLPSDSTQPPPAEEVARMAREKLQADPQFADMLHATGDEAGQAAAAKKQQMVAQLTPLAAHAIQSNNGQLPDASSLPAIPEPPDPDQASEAAIRAKFDEAVKAETDKLAGPYQKRRDDAKQFGQTLELVIGRLWKKGKLKKQAEPFVGSALTIGIGWLKVSWQERTGKDPIMAQSIADAQNNLRRIAVLRQEIAADDCGDLDAQKAALEQEIQGLEAHVEVVIARGLAIDFVAGEDIQVSLDCGSLANYEDAGWIAHRTFMPTEDMKEAFPRLTPEQIKSASLYHQVKPADAAEKGASGTLAEVSATDADSYRRGSDVTITTSDEGDGCIWELWNRDSNMILTFIEGVQAYAKDPYTLPYSSSRFYSFFQFQIGVIDGSRHPKSLITRSARLFDEYNRVRTGYAEHRRRIKPKTVFDSSALDENEVLKLEAGGTQEMVGIKPQIPGTPVKDLLAPVAYAQIDQALYDTGPIRSELEMIWGIQEALSSSIHTAKTATEAEIQQSGTNSRTGYMRDGLDACLSEVAQYTAEIALQMMTRQDVVEIAGPYALWPEGMKVDDLGSLVTVEIRAGSSGKPDTTRQRQAWATVMPILQNAIIQVGGLRGSSPADIADCVEELITETLERTGDRLDAARFLPSAPDANAQPAGAPGAPNPAMPGNPMAPVPTNAAPTSAPANDSLGADDAAA